MFGHYYITPEMLFWNVVMTHMSLLCVYYTSILMKIPISHDESSCLHCRLVFLVLFLEALVLFFVMLLSQTLKPVTQTLVRAKNA